MKLKLFYATNRRHEGADRWRPEGYGKDFSSDGMENLRFGRLTMEVDEEIVARHLNRRKGSDPDRGDGEALAGYLARRAGEDADIRAYGERLNRKISDVHQPNARLGSRALFQDLRAAMLSGCDVLVYVHGFNVSWEEAVGSALALQLMLNRRRREQADKEVRVMLFTWPSDGLALPYVSYKSDRSDAQGSGYAFGRGLLKLRDHLTGLKRDGEDCQQALHLLCHSMGNYVLQATLARMREFAAARGLPRLFEHIFLCAADVDDDVLEPGKPMGDLHRLARGVSIYHNRGDLAMYVSDYTKGHPDRLGHEGAARPGQLHRKIHQVDCSSLVEGLVEHSYYLWGPVNSDIRQTIDGLPPGDPARRRTQSGSHDNVWVMTGAM
ncbi:MAG TPA: alpha/beta hydrolase [Gammaproteobacteria bacterium]|nr:alpha/beta hydrolase [Gammaproteobacteria bacterium]